jgi:hypothetical protein
MPSTQIAFVNFFSEVNVSDRPVPVLVQYAIQHHIYSYEASSMLRSYDTNFVRVQVEL